MELTYYRKGDYLFPNLTIESSENPIGKYGMLRRTFLKEHKNSLVSEHDADWKTGQASSGD